MAMFNKISMHDDIDNILTSAGIRSARWGGQVLDYFMTFVIGNFPSTPLFNGILALLCLALSVYVIICHFEYESKLGLFVLTGIAITFPAITSFFGYVFTIHPYCFAILLSIYGSHLICKEKVLSTIWGIIFVGFAMSIYQVVLALSFTFLLFDFLKFTIKNELSIIRFLTLGLIYFLSGVLIVSFYWGIELLLLRTFGLTLRSYQGISSATQFEITDFFKRFSIALKFFFVPDSINRSNCFPLGTRFCYYLLLILLLIIYVNVIRMNKRNILKSIELSVLFVLIPFAINFVYIMCDTRNTEVHSLMMFPYISLYFFVVISFSEMQCLLSDKSFILKLKNIALGVVMVSIILNVRYSNMCYVKGIFLQEQAISYFTVLRNRIETVDGYQEGMPVVYINQYDKSISNIYQPEGFEEVQILPFSVDTIINDFAWQKFMGYWCGYYPNIYWDMESFDENDVVKQMPSYPNDGSIRIINDTLVVKF